MKKFVGMMVGLLVFFLFTSLSLAAGTCTGTPEYYNGRIVLSVTCTADAADASVPDYAFPGEVTQKLQDHGVYYLIGVTTRPGSPAPTDATDLLTNDDDGADVLGGAGTNKIDATSKMDFFPKNSDNELRFWPATKALTQVVSGNAVNSAEFTVEYIFAR